MKRLILFVVVLSYSVSLIAQSANLQVKQQATSGITKRKT
jgi:hypothetical protein